MGAGRLVPDASQLDELGSAFPYYTAPIATAVKDNASLGEGERILRMRLAISTGDRDALSALSGESAPGDFYGPETVPTSGTNETIDTFLERYGTNADKRETDALTKLIFSPTPDYSAVLAAEEQANPARSVEADATSFGIDSFLQSHPQATRKAASATPADSTPADSSLTESLARIMIKNRNYSKALEIITELSLKNSEKSAYFADQIRFLKKLIINDQNS